MTENQFWFFDSDFQPEEIRMGLLLKITKGLFLHLRAYTLNRFFFSLPLDKIHIFYILILYNVLCGKIA